MTARQEELYEEVDLRPYVEALIRRWQWIVGTAVAAAVLAFTVTSFLPPVYEASSLIAITAPRYRLQFDSRIQTVEEDTPVYRAFPEIALSDDVLAALFDRLETLPKGIGTPTDFRRIFSAENGNDPSLVRLSVTTEDPTISADVANAWAEIFVAQANNIFGGTDEENLLFLEEQLANSQRELAEAEASLAAFQARNRIMIITNRLDDLLTGQMQYLVEKRVIESVLEDAHTLRTQLDPAAASATASRADQIASLLLQIQAVSPISTSQVNTVVPVQLQISDSPEAITVAEQIDFLERLTAAQEAKAALIDDSLAALEPDILAEQQALQQLQAEEAALISNRDLVKETSLSLARKVEEARITSQDVEGQVQLASRAAVPLSAAGPSRLLIALIAGMLGLMFGVAWWGLRTWWQQSEQAT